MRLEETGVFENIEGRPGTRIDLDQRECLARDQKVEAVEADETDGGGEARRGLGELLFDLRGQIRRAHAAAEAERLPRRRRRPLTAGAERPRLAPIAKAEDRDRIARRDALEIDVLIAGAPCAGRGDMATACARRRF